MDNRYLDKPFFEPNCGFKLKYLRPQTFVLSDKEVEC